ncbi:oxidoreductase [Ameyamaea chiangmaiensis NBRC 103196]|uniref:SDR family NAD(P)-dependent oxidoreductase n=1 Tax=Ameyamaea chiangmaiensis TaxID=442969 RepID=A0A850P9W4_9PROT|nr:SDR family oxidoreductase [Ameyamaea chiangmaiensis]MBS4075994.1 SDR family NAD(P)-dependent oxidoreductase [Ameyamaea chiangmaiensis]NVN40824.1 SDR family NAD(P)-dependent oxidoreductase [Ameyamaea chiangmaiensis]GBQ61515.1 oxidoreductase [Ameyamaea chiangmaiensis NBRC 103196]
MPHQIAVVTGAGAGIGRATVRTLARAGCDVALIGRNRERLDQAAAELDTSNVRTLVIEADVADDTAIEAAAEQIEQSLGPITIWVNAAGTSVVGQVAELTAAEIRRATEVTYFGTVHGTLAALKRMRRRGYGTIVNLDLLPQLQGLPLQAVESGARGAVRGFSESLRPEIAHDADRINVALVHLPSINTPRLGWTRNHTGKRLKPVGMVYEPEIAADAICRAVFGHHQDIWVGASGLGTWALRTLAPVWHRTWLASAAYRRQLEKAAAPDDLPDTLEASPPGAYAAHGRFDTVAWKDDSTGTILFTPALRAGLITAAFATGFAALLVDRIRRRR